MEREVPASEESILSDDFVNQLTEIGEVDILVALPTRNHRQTIRQALSSAYVGLVQTFPRERAAILNLDIGSRDGTGEVFQQVSDAELRALLPRNPLRSIPRVSTSCTGAPAQRDAVRLLFIAADLLQAKACLRISPEFEHPQRLANFVTPVLKEGYDFVLPVYARHRLDGMLAKNILTPLIRAAYGHRISEPGAPEFCASGRLARFFLDQDIWRQHIDGDALGITMTTIALAAGFKTALACAGPRVHLSAYGKDLPVLVKEAVGALFHCLDLQQSYWIGQPPSQPPVVAGTQFGEPVVPKRINRPRMIQIFRAGTQELGEMLRVILCPQTAADLQRIAELPDAEFCFPDSLWARVIFDFAAAHHRSVLNRDHMLLALAPLLRGRIASFVRENQNARDDQADQRLEALGQEFERLKPYLLARWKNEGCL